MTHSLTSEARIPPVVQAARLRSSSQASRLHHGRTPRSGYHKPPIFTMRVYLPLLLTALLAVRASAADLRAGAAKTDITPPVGHPMWGYGARRDMACVGVKDP